MLGGVVKIEGGGDAPFETKHLLLDSRRVLKVEGRILTYLNCLRLPMLSLIAGLTYSSPVLGNWGDFSSLF